MAKVQAASTQQHVPIAGVRNGIVIMKDGSFRLILSISPINFSLKSEQEQNSIIFKYQSFLNSLHFPIQITMQSKRLDLTPYLQKMKKLASQQPNELLRVQTEDYVDFVGELINIANIMSKSFYLTISYMPISLTKVSFLDKLTGSNSTGNVLKISDTDFDTHSKELLERGNNIASNLGSIGLRVRQLPTQEILELFYNLYNPEEAGKERLIDVDDLEATVVIDKKEAQAAAAAHQKEQESPTIDNSQMVEAANRQQGADTNEKSQDQPDNSNPASEPIKEKTEAPPPIKQRLAPQNQTTDNQAPGTIPSTTTPTDQQADEPLANDNYQLK